MSINRSLLPTRGSTPTAADRKLAADLRRRLSLRRGNDCFALDLDEAAALVAAHRCRAEEQVWHHAGKALAASAA
jgi:hypothetical protein